MSRKLEMMGPEIRYERNINAGYVDDLEQRKIVEILTELHHEVLRRHSSHSLVSRIKQGLSFGSRKSIKGLYLWGGVGGGKTYLMDLFHESLPPGISIRMHFHHFMRRVHDELTLSQGKADPINQVAARFAGSTRIICFDEFFVSDIGDAMILGGLLDGLFTKGVTLVATSNVAPTDLYENGLQRSRFLPAIELIDRYMAVEQLDSGTDYRLNFLRKHAIYRVEGTDNLFSKSEFRTLAGGACGMGGHIEVNGRDIAVRYSAEGVVGFEFSILCGGPRSASDYVEIACLFHTVVIWEIHQLNEEHNDEARRFISLIDEFYDRGVKVLFNASVEVTNLYVGSSLSSEFERTRSRIIEMRSDAYLSRPHRA
ncbi:MAG: AFG1 family ATPase [Pseudomonadales bacterium]|nr:AFG1 family ATPase [Pseudomonadales bacterium]